MLGCLAAAPAASAGFPRPVSHNVPVHDSRQDINADQAYSTLAQVTPRNVYALHATDGTLAWSFAGTAGPGQPGHSSRKGQSWKLGGGDAWMAPAFDAQLGLLYLAVANPQPRVLGAAPGNTENLASETAMAPEIMTVPAGTTVTFVNPAGNSHDHCAEAFFDPAQFTIGPIAPGHSGTYHFVKSGDYFYNDCAGFPWDTGEIIVR